MVGSQNGHIRKNLTQKGVNPRDIAWKVEEEEEEEEEEWSRCWVIERDWGPLFSSILGCVPPLQEVALRQIPPSFSVLCYSCSYRSLLPLNVISPATYWSSNWSYTLHLPLCASNSPSIVFHSGDVSSPFPFHIGYILDCVSNSGSLPSDGQDLCVWDFVWPVLLLLLVRQKETPISSMKVAVHCRSPRLQ